MTLFCLFVGEVSGGGGAGLCWAEGGGDSDGGPKVKGGSNSQTDSGDEGRKKGRSEVWSLGSQVDGLWLKVDGIKFMSRMFMVNSI